MTALEKIIRDKISSQGAIPLDDYMQLALQHPEFGYYRVKQPLGREGDFVTSPEISQMFGEMIGVWCAETWRSLGAPDPFALVELGPGRGTMMRDIFRATTHVGGFHQAQQLCLIDSDKALRAEQRGKLGEEMPRYVDSINQLPPMPAIIVANEFFDALPVRQFEKGFRGWCERKVAFQNDCLTTILEPIADDTIIPPDLRAGLPGTVFETSPQSQEIMGDLCRHLATQKGALLIIDYGYTACSGKATVQAVSNHAFADIFDRPGEIDLTAHVDFATLSRLAREAGLQVSPITGQGDFLKNIGIDIRADTLKKRATLPQAAEIDVALRRLTEPDQMGTLFKVIEIRG